MNRVTTLSRTSLFSLMLLLAGCAGLPSIHEEQHQAEQGGTETLSLAAQLRMQKNQFADTRANASRTERANFQRIQDLLVQQNSEKAIEVCKEWLATTVRASQSHVICGDAHLANNIAESKVEAVFHYQQALQINPHNYFAHNRLAGVLRSQGRFDEALQHYNKAIQAWPGFTSAYRNRAILNDLYIGDKAAALEDYQTYQMLHTEEQGEASRQIKGWIADLTRQIQNSTEVARNGN